MTKIVAVVGMCGSGKSEVVRLLVEKGFRRVYFGAPTFTEMDRLGLPLTEANERTIREGLRTQHGMAAMAILSLDAVRAEAAQGDVVIESLYSWEEFIAVEKEFPRIKLIAVHAPKERRYSQLSTRKKRPLTKEEVITRDRSQIENLHTGGPIAYADHVIVNDGTLEELRQRVDEVLTELNSHSN